MAEDETTFLCGYKGLRRYGTTTSVGARKPNYYTIIKHTVLPSDTLQGIALKYGASTTEIKRFNKLWSNDSIHLREILSIPISCSEASPSSVVGAPFPNGPDSCYDSMSETEDHQFHHHQNRHETVEKKKCASEDDEGAMSSTSMAGGLISKRSSVVDVQRQRAASTSYDKSDCSIKDLLSRIDSSIQLTAKNVKRLEKQSTLEQMLHDNGTNVSPSLPTSSSRNSFRDISFTGTPSPSEIRTEVRRPLGRYSMRKLEEMHDQLYQL